jgi:hypothetical protein
MPSLTSINTALLFSTKAITLLLICFAIALLAILAYIIFAVNRRKTADATERAEQANIDRRKAARQQLQLPVLISSDPNFNDVEESQTFDISDMGCFVGTKTAYSPGDVIYIMFVTTGQQERGIVRRRQHEREGEGAGRKQGGERNEKSGAAGIGVEFESAS